MEEVELRERKALTYVEQPIQFINAAFQAVESGKSQLPAKPSKDEQFLLNKSDQDALALYHVIITENYNEKAS